MEHSFVLLHSFVFRDLAPLSGYAFSCISGLYASRGPIPLYSYFSVFVTCVLTSHHLLVCLFSFVVPVLVSTHCVVLACVYSGPVLHMAYSHAKVTYGCWRCWGTSLWRDPVSMLLTFWGPLWGIPLLVVVYSGTPYGAPAMGDISFLGRCYLGHQLYTWATPMQKLPTGAGAAGELLYEGIQSGRDATKFWGPSRGCPFSLEHLKVHRPHMV